MFRLREPIVVHGMHTPPVRVGAFSPNVDFIVPVVVSGAVGFLFGKVLWGCTGGLIGGVAGIALGATTMSLASAR